MRRRRPELAAFGRPIVDRIDPAVLENGDRADDIARLVVDPWDAPHQHGFLSEDAAGLWVDDQVSTLGGVERAVLGARRALVGAAVAGRGADGDPEPTGAVAALADELDAVDAGQDSIGGGAESQPRRTGCAGDRLPG